MFNLFGNFFFGRSSTTNNETTTPSPVEDTASITQTTEMSTQTPSSQTVDDQLLMMTTSQTTTQLDGELHKQWVIVERAKQQQQQQQVATSTTHLDDVKEEDENRDEERAVEESEMKEEDDTDVFIGSFFDRNLFDERPVESAVPVVPTRDEWLITPLPCLTSITCSQRSLVDNDPLENLLIEHPSMSVFVTVTSSAMAEPKTPTTKEAAVFKVFSENVEKKETKESSLDKMVVVSQRKRKGMETAAHQSPSPTSTMRRKASKRNKKSSPVSLANNANQQMSPVSTQQTTTETVAAANKENNSQVRTLLSSEYRSKVNPSSKLDSILLSKNQMKRKNKHANKFNSNNCIQRKFHKLQQPVCC